MNQNRAMMRTELASLTAERQVCQNRAKTVIDTIMPLINPTLKVVEKMDIAEAALQMDKLVMYQAELLALQSKIEALNEALFD